MNSTTVEKQALMFATAVNFIMAIAGWLAFYLSNSQAVLLDGNFSFIAALTTLAAIRISSIKDQRTEVFPFGQFAYEALFSLLKGIMIIGTLLMALTSNITKLFHYIAGTPSETLNTSVIIFYAFIMVFLCASLAFYCNYQNKKINNSSTILRAEYSAAKIDGFMSLAIGIALFGIRFLDIEGTFGFLHFIGDALLVIILVFFLGKEPFVLVCNSFIELAGGTLQNQEEKKSIETILKSHFDHTNLFKDSYIFKTGSSYLIVVYVNAKALNEVPYENLKQIKQRIVKKLDENYPNTILEIVLS